MNKRLLAVIVIQFVIILTAGNLCYGAAPASDRGNSAVTSNPAGTDEGMILAQASGDETPASTEVPAISIPETSFDFGTVSQASKLTHKFVIHNNGEAPLKLISAKGS